MICPRCHVILTQPLKDHMAIHLGNDIESFVWRLKSDMREYGIPEVRFHAGLRLRTEERAVTK